LAIHEKRLCKDTGQTIKSTAPEVTLHSGYFAQVLIVREVSDSIKRLFEGLS